MKKQVHQYANVPGFKRTPDYILEAQKQHIVGDELETHKHRRRHKKKRVDKVPEPEYIAPQEEPVDPVIEELEEDCFVEFVK